MKINKIFSNQTKIMDNSQSLIRNNSNHVNPFHTSSILVNQCEKNLTDLKEIVKNKNFDALP
jgi:hypothetical protein